eukprot:321809-Pleurochrysis_carterae.AAC.1
MREERFCKCVHWERTLVGELETGDMWSDGTVEVDVRRGPGKGLKHAGSRSEVQENWALYAMWRSDRAAMRGRSCAHRVRHRVERPQRHRELVDDVEVLKAARGGVRVGE